MPAEDPHSMTRPAGTQRTAGRMDAGRRPNHARASDPPPGVGAHRARMDGARTTGERRGELGGWAPGRWAGVHTEMHTKRRLCSNIKACVRVNDPYRCDKGLFFFFSFVFPEIKILGREGYGVGRIDHRTGAASPPALYTSLRWYAHPAGENAR